MFWTKLIIARTITPTTRLTITTTDTLAIQRALSGVVCGIAIKLGGRGVGMMLGSYTRLSKWWEEEEEARMLWEEDEEEGAGMILMDPLLMVAVTLVRDPVGRMSALADIFLNDLVLPLRDLKEAVPCGIRL